MNIQPAAWTGTPMAYVLWRDKKKFGALKGNRAHGSDGSGAPKRASLVLLEYVKL